MRLLVFLIVLSFSNSMAQDLKLMTYNIRYDNAGDGDNRWDNRKEFLASQWMFHTPDVVGIQEGMHHQVAFLDEHLADYEYVGVGRDDGKNKGEYSAIFYRNELNVVDHGTFWLSETPDRVSVGWDASMERICTYAHFQKDNFSFWVFNTHFDHIGEKARENSAGLILEKIAEIAGAEHVFIMGDFNLEPTAVGIQKIKQKYKDSFDIGKVKLGPVGTYNGFDHSKEATRRIDYIFVDDRLVVNKYGVLSDAVHQRYPSDHFPVLIQVSPR